jgi:hypothetical protein
MSKIPGSALMKSIVFFQRVSTKLKSFASYGIVIAISPDAKIGSKYIQLR